MRSRVGQTPGGFGGTVRALGYATCSRGAARCPGQVLRLPAITARRGRRGSAVKAGRRPSRMRCEAALTAEGRARTVRSPLPATSAEGDGRQAVTPPTDRSQEPHKAGRDPSVASLSCCPRGQETVCVSPRSSRSWPGSRVGPAVSADGTPFALPDNARQSLSSRAQSHPGQKEEPRHGAGSAADGRGPGACRTHVPAGRCRHAVCRRLLCCQMVGGHLVQCLGISWGFGRGRPGRGGPWQGSLRRWPSR